MAFLNIADITKPMHESLKANVCLARACDSRYDGRFRQSGAQVGDTITVRYPDIAEEVVTGRIANPGSPSDYGIPVTLVQYNVSKSVTAKELSLNVDDFKMQILDPMAAKMAAHVDGLVAAQIKYIPQAYGTPGTAVTKMKDWNKARGILATAGCHDLKDLKGFLTHDTSADLIDGMSGLFNSPGKVSRQFDTGFVGRASNIDFYESNLLGTHVMGVIGASTPLMKGTTAEGATQIVTDGWASGGANLKAGDHIQIAGVYALNPVTGANTGRLKSFVVTENVSDSSGDMTIKISPAISLSGIDAVSALPTNDAAVSVWGDTTPTNLSGLIGQQNLLMHKDAIIVASADFAKLPGLDVRTVRDPELGGIPFSIGMDSDLRNHEVLIRMDCLVGVALGRKNFAVKVLG